MTMTFLLPSLFAAYFCIIVNAQQSLLINNNSATQPPTTLIRVAFLVAQNDTDYGLRRKNSAFRNSAGAITLALDRLWREGALPDGLNFTFQWRYEKCVASNAAGYTYEFVNNYKADLIIGTPCIDAPPIIGFIASYYNLPMLVWGQSLESRLTNSKVYPTLLSILPNYRNMARTVGNVMANFNWTLFAVVIQADIGGVSGGCLQLSRDIDTAINERKDCSISYKARIFNMNTSTYTDNIIDQIRQRARIVLMCFDDIRQQRAFALALFDAGLNTNDYVYIFPDYDMTLALDLNKPPYWIQKRRDDVVLVEDGRNGDAEVIGRLSFFIHLDITTNISDAKNAFYDRVIAKMQDWPFNCADCGSRDGENASIYSPLLYDAFYAYGLSLADTINQSRGLISPNVYRNGSLIAKNSKRTFQGMTGTVRIGADGKRQGIFALSNRKGKNENNELQILINFAITDTTPIITIKNTSIWASRGGVAPLAVPKCGFDGNGCQISAIELYKGYLIAAIILFVLIMGATITAAIYLIHARMEDRRRADLLWQIPYMMLARVKHKQKTRQTERSQRSLLTQSSAAGCSTSRLTVDSVFHSKSFILYTYKEEKCCARKHGPASAAMQGGLTQTDMAELRMLRMMDNENLNRFYGLCLDGPEILSVWKFCARGSIRDVLGNNTLTKDAVFIHSIICEIAEGLNFIHNSPLQFHGNLKSAYCLIDERWQVKISYYGIRKVHKQSQTKARDLIWKAPEQLRSLNEEHNLLEGTKQADIYSMALIFSEVVNMRPCWEEEGGGGGGQQPAAGPTETSHDGAEGGGGQRSGRRQRRNAEEIVYLVKKGGTIPLRPRLRPAVQEMNPAMLDLIRDCWQEDAAKRPKIDKVKNALKWNRAGGGNASNLMDHVFSLLEQYANTLEQEVEERTKEMEEEKRKSDVLLYRMLPKQVADRLKLGQSVEPEHFGCVTVFFSDVVGFTQISSQLKPLQVVNLMNELFTACDGIIAEHDVYKVEVIGDGYLCVSGLPHRNGDKHAKECADMALRFIKCLANFEIPGLLSERIRIRIGLHSGPCVAGVVGLAMPRYCLFGDTVNTASRMESASQANKIHISKETQQFLSDHFEGYLMEPRGDIIIKGKGVMQTYWLLGHTNVAKTGNNNNGTDADL